MDARSAHWRSEVAEEMSNYRIAKSLDVFRAEANILWPRRSKASDGWVGDTSHAARKSDHNPDARGIVHAFDLTHDPANGPDTYAVAEHLRQIKDPRINYIISAGRICSSTVAPWTWRKYNGANGHFHHLHVSVRGVPWEDDTTPWDLSTELPLHGLDHPPPVPPTLRKGSARPDVETLQKALGKVALAVKVDGFFGKATEDAVKLFQVHSGIGHDGVVGPMTWNALGVEGAKK